ncbi:MAG TPA: hypothetical protein VFQ76_13410 [Longimicrobiaceae bacterium]|nr:hypothetical protein [Longimicrobiaceae bacterium]
MRRIPFASAPLAVALLAGCAGLVVPDDTGTGLSIRTERAEYTVSRSGPYLETTIGLSLTNGTDGPAYLATCHGVHPPHLEKRVGDRWVPAYAAAVPQCLGPPEVVEPGETFPYSFRVSAVLPGNNDYPSFQVDPVPGTYRLVWTVYRTWEPDGGSPGLGEQFPREAAVSNEFTLRD